MLACSKFDNVIKLTDNVIKLIDPTFTQLATVQLTFPTNHLQSHWDWRLHLRRNQTTLGQTCPCIWSPKDPQIVWCTAIFPTYHRHDWNCVPTRRKIPITTSLSSGTKWIHIERFIWRCFKNSQYPETSAWPRLQVRVIWRQMLIHKYSPQESHQYYH